jgi:hypothetical protein
LFKVSHLGQSAKGFLIGGKYRRLSETGTDGNGWQGASCQRYKLSKTIKASSKMIVRISRCGVDVSRIFTHTNRVKARRVEMQFMGSMKFWQFIRS